ncbi:uncharacterized protein [Apostichopus japonicus]|uniref:uncharacterized protein n=1 Tax=Stichopus japonicus TaxID=307972 RepID=UPI003AB35B9C
MADTASVKMEDAVLPENGLLNNSDSSEIARTKITNAPVRVKLRNVRLRKPNWTLRESQDLLDEFEKLKMILNSRGNTGVSTKAKRKLAWGRIAQKINSKGHSAVKRTVYECKRRWKNMVTFAKLSILEFVKAIKLGGDPSKKVSEMDRRITEVHGDLKLLQTLQFAEHRDLDALSDVVEVEPASEVTGSASRTDENIGFSPTSIFGNHAVHVPSVQQSNRSQQPSKNPRQYFSDYALDNDTVSQNFEEQTPSIENYYSLQANNQEQFNNTNGIQSGQLNDHSFDEEPRYYRGVALDSEDPQETALRKRKLQLEVEKLQLEKEVLEMQKVKIRLETKAWRKMVGQRATPTQTPPPFAMTPFYWPSPTPGFPAFYGTSPNIAHPGMSQMHANSTMKKKD